MTIPIESLFEEYLRFIFVGAAVPLGVSAAAGLAVGILQAATQIQEQTIGYLVKVTAVGMTMWLGGERFISEGLQLFSRTFAVIALLGEAK